jgi:hypothetical protein
MNNETRWFRVTYIEDWIVPAANAAEAEELFWASDRGLLVLDGADVTVLDIDECDGPLELQ